MRKMLFLLGCLLFLQFSAVPATVHAQDIPDTIYKWVMASPRASYYFNKQQIKFVTDAQGKVNPDVIEVPILEQYDWIKKEDVIDKRRWNDLDMTGFGDLWGYAALVHIDIQQQTVSYIYEMYLNSYWTPIWKFDNNNVTDLKQMSDKNLDKIFYETIINYAKENRQLILQNQGAAAVPALPTVQKLEHLTEREKVQKILDTYNERTKNQDKNVQLTKVKARHQ